MALVSCLALEVLRIRYNYAADGRLQHAPWLTALSVLLLLALTTTGMIPLPPGLNLPFFGIWPRWSDLLKAIVSFLLIFVWTVIALRLTPDTPTGVAIILIPDAALTLAALVYLSNGLSARAK